MPLAKSIAQVIAQYSGDMSEHITLNAHHATHASSGPGAPPLSVAAPLVDPPPLSVAAPPVDPPPVVGAASPPVDPAPAVSSPSVAALVPPVSAPSFGPQAPTTTTTSPSTIRVSIARIVTDPRPAHNPGPTEPRITSSCKRHHTFCRRGSRDMFVCR